MTREIRKGLYTTDTPLPTTPPPPVPLSPVGELYRAAPYLRGMRASFPSHDRSLVIDGIAVTLVDYTPESGRREWYAYVYSEPSVNVEPFFSKQMLTWWLRSEDGILAVKQAFAAGAGPTP